MIIFIKTKKKILLYFWKVKNPEVLNDWKKEK